MYRIQKNEINVTDLTLNISAPVISTWPEGGVLPDQSELTFIQFDGCCPNKCSNDTICKNTVGGSFLCLNVYLEFDYNMIPDAIIGNFQLSDGMTGQALWLDGATTIDLIIPGNSGCWRQLSTCETRGFTLAFWIKVISNSGFENHQDTVGVITAMRAWGKEGWGLKLMNSNSNHILKMHVADMQNPDQHAWKEIDKNVLYHEWNHYITVYQYALPNNDANVLFQFYKNGQPHNNGFGHFTSDAVNQDIVDKLAFGRRYFNTNSGPYANVMLDEVMIIDGDLDDSSAFNLYQSYPI